MNFRFLTLLLALPVLAQDATTPPKPWSTNVGAGLAITSGNTDTKSLNFSYTYDYKTLPPAGIKKGDSALFAALLFKF